MSTAEQDLDRTWDILRMIAADERAPNLSARQTAVLKNLLGALDNEWVRTAASRANVSDTEDGELFVRCAAVLAGRAVYERLVEDPKLLDRDWDVSSADLLLRVAPDMVPGAPESYNFSNASKSPKLRIILGGDNEFALRPYWEIIIELAVRKAQVSGPWKEIFKLGGFDRIMIYPRLRPDANPKFVRRNRAKNVLEIEVTYPPPRSILGSRAYVSRLLDYSLAACRLLLK